jgi:hypothetical protein
MEGERRPPIIRCAATDDDSPGAADRYCAGDPIVEVNFDDSDLAAARIINLTSASCALAAVVADSNQWRKVAPEGRAIFERVIGRGASEILASETNHSATVSP